MTAVSKQQKEATRIIRESSKVDLAVWLAGGKPRTATVRLSNDPALAEQLDAIAQRMNDLAEKIDAAEQDDDEPSGGLGDDSPADELRAEWQQLKAEYDPLNAQYEAGLAEFTLRGQRPTDRGHAIEALTKAGVSPITTDALTVGLLAVQIIDPLLTLEQVQAIADTIDVPEYNKLIQALNELTQPVKAPTAPLSLRP